MIPQEGGRQTLTSRRQTLTSHPGDQGREPEEGCSGKDSVSHEMWFHDVQRLLREGNGMV